VYREEKRCQRVSAKNDATSGTSGTSGTQSCLLGGKSLPKKGLEERVNLDAVGVFEPRRIDETLLDVPANGTSGDMK